MQHTKDEGWAGVADPLCQEAAARIEALERELAALKSAPADEAAMVEAMAEEWWDCEHPQVHWRDANVGPTKTERRKYLERSRAALTALRPHLTARDAETRTRALEDAIIAVNLTDDVGYSTRYAERAIRALIERERRK